MFDLTPAILFLVMLTISLAFVSFNAHADQSQEYIQAEGNQIQYCQTTNDDGSQTESTQTNY